VADDTISPRQATLGDIGFQAGQENEMHILSEESGDTRGLFEESGIYSKVLENKLLVEGEYTFHFRAETTGSCVYTREVMWSIHVDPGIDPSKTDMTTDFTATRPDGKAEGTITFTPRDPYGNPIGPGRIDIIIVSGGPGTETGGITDNGNGSYTVPIVWDPTTGIPPTIIITPPGGISPIVIQVPGACTPPVIDVPPGGGTCALCNPAPGKNHCDPTAPCTSTPFGNMCTCRPGYRSNAAVTNTDVQWRLKWPTDGHEHRVFVKPGEACDKLCNEYFLGAMSCGEVSVKKC
jgi:hypothetical protein